MSDAAPLPRRLLAEALGTAILVATVVGSGIMADKLAGGNQAVALLGNTIPTGAILVVLILCFASAFAGWRLYKAEKMPHGEEHLPGEEGA